MRLKRFYDAFGYWLLYLHRAPLRLHKDQGSLEVQGASHAHLMPSTGAPVVQHVNIVVEERPANSNLRDAGRPVSL